MIESAFRGSSVALVTPFERSGRIDEDSLKRLIDRQIGGDIDVILVAGTTGESATLSWEELEWLFQATVGHVRGRRPVLAGTGTNSTAKSIKLTELAGKCSCDGILSVAPYYNKPTQEGLYQHFRAIAESTPLPLVLYNVPGRTGSNISAETTLRLAELENIVGIKEASGDFSQIMQILQYRPEGFLVLSGDDAVALPLLALGSDGVVSVVANQVPDKLSGMVQAAFSGDWARARRLHYELLPLMEVNFVETNPIPVKTSLAMMGLLEEEFRLPLVPMSRENRARLKEKLEDAGLI